MYFNVSIYSNKGKNFSQGACWKMWMLLQRRTFMKVSRCLHKSKETSRILEGTGSISRNWSVCLSHSECVYLLNSSLNLWRDWKNPLKPLTVFLTVHLKQDKKKSVSHLWRRTFKNIPQINFFFFFLITSFMTESIPQHCGHSAIYWRPTTFVNLKKISPQIKASSGAKRTDGEQCIRGHVWMI